MIDLLITDLNNDGTDWGTFVDYRSTIEIIMHTLRSDSPVEPVLGEINLIKQRYLQFGEQSFMTEQ